MSVYKKLKHFKIIIVRRMEEDITNLILDPYYSKNLPEGVTCMGWGCCIYCGDEDTPRGTNYCGKGTCWKKMSAARIIAIDGGLCTIKFDIGEKIVNNVLISELKHFKPNKTAGIFEVNDIVWGKIDGCTKIATRFSLRNDTYKWLVCEYCSNRGLYALNEYLSYLGYRYDLATNEKL